MKLNIDDEDAKKIKIMRSLNFFSSFTDAELVAILRTSKWLKFMHGDIIVREGDKGRSFYIVMKGCVAVQKKFGNSKIRKPLLCLSKGQCFGEVAVVSGRPRGADIIADCETYVLKIDADALNADDCSPEYKVIQLKYYRIFASILAEKLVLTDDLLVKEMLI